MALQIRGQGGSGQGAVIPGAPPPNDTTVVLQIRDAIVVPPNRPVVFVNTSTTPVEWPDGSGDSDLLELPIVIDTERCELLGECDNVITVEDNAGRTEVFPFEVTPAGVVAPRVSLQSSETGTVALGTVVAFTAEASTSFGFRFVWLVDGVEVGADTPGVDIVTNESESVLTMAINNRTDVEVQLRSALGGDTLLDNASTTIDIFAATLSLLVSRLPGARVRIEPANVYCTNPDDRPCVYRMPIGTNVTLVPEVENPEEESRAIFSVWEGDCSSAGEAVNFTVESDVSCIARYRWSACEDAIAVARLLVGIDRQDTDSVVRLSRDLNFGEFGNVIADTLGSSPVNEDVVRPTWTITDAEGQIVATGTESLFRIPELPPLQTYEVTLTYGCPDESPTDSFQIFIE